MKVLGLNDTSVIVELAAHEWHAIGGEFHMERGIRTIKVVPDVYKMANALEQIRDEKPDLEQVRATFKTFLMLTDPARIQEVLESCGVAQPIVDDVVELKEGDSVE